MHNTLLNLYAEHEADLARESGDAVASKRRAAIDRFEALGFPTKQWESWKYTALKTTLAT